MNPEVQARAEELRRDRVPHVHARVVRAERPTSAKAGDEAVILPDGTIDGFVGGECAAATVRAQSLSLLDSGESLLLRISPEAEPRARGAPGGAAGAGRAGGADPTAEGRGDATGAARPAGATGHGAAGASRATGEGTLTVVNPCLSGGTLEIFLEPVIPSPTLAVFGDSPIAAALAALAGHAGCQVGDAAGALGVIGRLADRTAPAAPAGTARPAGSAEPVDSVRPGPAVDPSLVAVVVASHGRDEEPLLEAAVRAEVPYVGLVASRKRGEAVVAGLDLDDAQRARVHTPAGLDIGARTPHEVALSILAEIVSLRPRPSGRPLPAAGSTEAARHQAAGPGDPDHAGEAAAGGPSRALRPGDTGGVSRRHETGRAGETGGLSSPGAADAVGETGEAGETETAAGHLSRGGARGIAREAGTPGGRPSVAVDPVCGMSVVADDTALHLDHGGARYWFCGTGCLRAFAADPNVYLSPPS